MCTLKVYFCTLKVCFCKSNIIFLYLERIHLYFESALLYFESILLYFATTLASGCIENQYSKGKENMVINVHLKNANLLAVGDTTYAYFM